MNILIQGVITDIFPAETYGNFTKRVAWVQEVDVQYPNTYALEFQQGDGTLLDYHVPGDVVKCSVDVRGRKWEKNGKAGCINTLKCWKIERVGQQAKPTPSTRQQTGGIPPKNAQQADPMPKSDVTQEEDDSLPF